VKTVNIVYVKIAVLLIEKYLLHRSDSGSTLKLYIGKEKKDKFKKLFLTGMQKNF